jgi:hypothetical protein
MRTAAQLSSRAALRRHRRVPAAFAAIVDACLAPEPSERPSVADLSAPLGGIV